MARHGAARRGKAWLGVAGQAKGTEFENKETTMRYKFELTGTSPLIMHANNIEARDAVEAERKKMRGGKAGDDRSPPSTWKTYLDVSDETENICIPFENLLAMLLQAGVKVKIRGKETLKSHSQFLQFDRPDFELLVNGAPISRSVIDAIDGEFTEHANAARAAGFRLMVKPVTIGTSKHIRVRPVFSNWSLVGDFEVDADDGEILTLSALQDLWSTGGRRAGLGDWRPGAPKRPGQYGRFTAQVTRL
jgi:hypothetical protein